MLSGGEGAANGSTAFSFSVVERFNGNSEAPRLFGTGSTHFHFHCLGINPVLGLFA
jgi:hypothetical protein